MILAEVSEMPAMDLHIVKDKHKSDTFLALKRAHLCKFSK